MEPERLLPNSAYSGRITHHSEADASGQLDGKRATRLSLYPPGRRILKLRYYGLKNIIWRIVEPLKNKDNGVSEA